MIRRTGQFNRLSFFTHIEELKKRILTQNAAHADIIIPVLTQLQSDIDGWTAVKRYKRAYGSLMLRELEGTRDGH